MDQKNHLGGHVAMVVLWLLVVCWAGLSLATAAELAPVTTESRCPVCGMFVAKYPTWLSQVQLSDGSVAMFDGPKDMFAFILAPTEYGVSAVGSEVDAVRVRDYYTLAWLDGRQAYYVTGSDVLGPMGHELIPFDSAEAAEEFLRDHHGQQILRFDDITVDLVRDMQKGHKMKK